MEVLDGLDPVHTLDVVGNVFHRTGTVEGQHRHDVLVSGWTHLSQDSPEPSPFYLKDPRYFTTREKHKAFRVVQGDRIKVQFDTVSLIDQVAGLVHHGESTQAQKVHF